MNKALIDRAIEHAKAEYPRESCGVIHVFKGRERYAPCRNIAESDQEFEIHGEDLANAEDIGPITAIVHSHCDRGPEPSEADLRGCETTKRTWLIVSVPSETWHILGTGQQLLPLYGRQFVHGLLDCYSFIEDWYRQELKIELRPYVRDEEWWLKGQNIYMENVLREGFIRLKDDEPLSRGDLIFMQIASPVPNHAAVYLGDGMVGHHLQGRLSGYDTYGGWFQKITCARFRHQTMMGAPHVA